jgi:hypothetical protein
MKNAAGLSSTGVSNEPNLSKHTTFTTLGAWLLVLGAYHRGYVLNGNFLA